MPLCTGSERPKRKRSTLREKCRIPFASCQAWKKCLCKTSYFGSRERRVKTLTTPSLQHPALNTLASPLQKWNPTGNLEIFPGILYHQVIIRYLHGTEVPWNTEEFKNATIVLWGTASEVATCWGKEEKKSHSNMEETLGPKIRMSICTNHVLPAGSIKWAEALNMNKFISTQQYITTQNCANSELQLASNHWSILE